MFNNHPQHQQYRQQINTNTFQTNTIQMMPLELTSQTRPGNAAAAATTTDNNHQQHDSASSAFASRSQSAPLHRHMLGIGVATAVAVDGSRTGSFASSLAPTPIPTEFSDFNGCGSEAAENLLLETTASTGSSQIKCEPMCVGSYSSAAGSDVDMQSASSSLQMLSTQHQRMQNNHQHQQQQHPHQQHQQNHFMSARQSSSSTMSVSRSVPSTPQPSQMIPMFGNQLQQLGNSAVTTPFGATHQSMYGHAGCDISKSVPTTPTGLMSGGGRGSQHTTMSTPFRYSPLELLNRDFLINGNTVVDSSQSQTSAAAASQSTSRMTAFFDVNSQSADGQQSPSNGGVGAGKLVAGAGGADVNDDLSSAFGDEAGADNHPIVGSDLLRNVL